MRLVIITQNAPVYLPTFLDQFLKKVVSKHNIVNFVVLSSKHKRTFFQVFRERADYYGAVGFVQMSLYILYQKALSLFLYSRNKYSVKQVLKKYSLNLLQISSINSQEFIRYIKEKEIELVVSIASPTIFKGELLQAPAKGCINYHTGLLPKYRGRQPLFWALLNDEEEFGITVHFMNHNIDDGPIISQKKITIDHQDSLHNLYCKNIEQGPDVLVDSLEKIDNEPCKNESTQATYYSFPKKQDSHKFRKKGKTFF
jgi:methionyl-tRNA formyltransferase